MKDRDRQALETMQQRLAAYSSGQLELGLLIADLEQLIALLESVSEQWRDAFHAQWAVLEVTYAVAIDRNLAIESEMNRAAIAPALAKMRQMLFELLPIQVPYSFIRRCTHLTWKEAMHGIEAGFVQIQSAPEIAIDRMQEGDNGDLVVELAGSTQEACLLNLVSRLAQAEGAAQSIESIRRKWAFLILAWEHEHPSSNRNPCEVLKKVYEDLAHPAQVEPMLCGRDFAESGECYRRWVEYLQTESAYFVPSERGDVGHVAP